MKRYLIVIEKAAGNWGAHAPDLPGCVALGDTVDETLHLMREAMDMHVSAMVEDGETIPPPSTLPGNVEVSVPGIEQPQRYEIIIERATLTNFAASAPDVVGCSAYGNTVDETRDNIRLGLEEYFEEMAQAGTAIPEPAAIVDYIEVDVPEPVKGKST